MTTHADGSLCPKLIMIEEKYSQWQFHSILMCRIWICSETLISWLDIRIRVHLTHFWKIWLFSSTSALATTSCYKLTEPCWQWCWQLLEYQDFQKRAKNSLNFPKMCQMHPNTDVQLWNQFLIINSDSTHQKLMKFAFIVTGSIFLQWYRVSDRVGFTNIHKLWNI